MNATRRQCILLINNRRCSTFPSRGVLKRSSQDRQLQMKVIKCHCVSTRKNQMVPSAIQSSTLHQNVILIRGFGKIRSTSDGVRIDNVFRTLASYDVRPGDTLSLTFSSVARHLTAQQTQAARLFFENPHASSTHHSSSLLVGSAMSSASLKASKSAESPSDTLESGKSFVLR